MQIASEIEPALVAGTYNGHPVNAAAAIATLRCLSKNEGAIYRQIDARKEKGVEKGVGHSY